MGREEREVIAAAAVGLCIGGCRIVIGGLILVISVVIVGGMICAALRGELGPPPPPTPMAPRRIIASTLPLHENWRRDNVVLPYYDERLVASKEYICYVTYAIRGWKREDRLQVLRGRNGEIHWEVPNFPYINSLATDGKRLFAAVEWHIRAYDLATGRLLWRTPGSLPGHTGYWLQPEEEDIVVYFKSGLSVDREEQFIQRYDAQNGTLKTTERIEVPSGVRLMIRTPLVDYWTDGERIWAQNRISGQILWEREIERRIEHRPILTDSSLIYASGIYAHLYAVDAASGTLQWVYPGFVVSNFVLSGGILYAVRQDGALVGIDPRTGQEIGFVQFLPAKTNRRSTAYWVAASDGWVFVYFGDSQELIALGPRE